MLISKIVMVKWSKNNKKWYEERNYIFTNYKNEFEVKTKDLPDHSKALVDIECDGCGEILTGIIWANYKKCVHEDGKYYCHKCANKLFGTSKRTANNLLKSKSFGQWCYDNKPKNIADIIIKRWDDNLNIDENGNKLSPFNVSYSSMGFNKKGYWFKCLDHPEHESELKKIDSFVNGHYGTMECKQCNSISITHPHLMKYLVNKEDGYKYSHGSGKKIPFNCPDCGHEKRMAINILVSNGFACPKCSDGISYPNKFMFNVLDQLINLNKIEDFYIEKRFNWLVYEFKGKLRKGKLDFYFELGDKKCGIEMDGGFHGKDNKMSGQTAEESKYIDDEKDRLYKENNVYVVRVNSEKSELEWLKNKIIESNIFVFKESDIDWLKCHEYACSSNVKVVCDLWNSGIKNLNQIANDAKISRITTSRYLKQGVKLGWSDYDGKEAGKRNLIQMNINNFKKAICLTTGEIFNSFRDVYEKYKIASSGMSNCCRGIQKSAGKLPDGTKLVWKYYEDYLKELSEKDGSFILGGINE